MNFIDDFINENHRLNALCDGVFAIAITLLVLELKLPESESIETTAQLTHALTEILPSLFSYLISFYVIGAYWSLHHRLFRYVVHCDAQLIKKTLSFLLGISLLPFITHLHGKFGQIELSVALYALNVAFCGYTLAHLWHYVSQQSHLLAEGVSDEIIEFYKVRLLITPSIFLLSVPVAFYNPNAARLLWILLLWARPIMNRILKNKSKKMKRIGY